jgi:membrane protease YdiL (CAAX protease family)
MELGPPGDPLPGRRDRAAPPTGLRNLSGVPSVPPPETQLPPSPPAATAADAAPARQADLPPWPAWTAPAAIVAGFGVGVVVSVIVGIAASAGGSSLSHPTPAVSLIGDVLFDAGFVAAALYFARLFARPRPVDFGFRAVGWRTAVASVVAAGIGYYVITAIYASLLKLHGSEKLPKELGVGSGTAALVGASIFVCVIAPIAEEFFFRGFVFGALRRMRVEVAGRQLGTGLAAVLTAILFGLAHTGSASSRYLIPLGFLGFVLCLLRWRTRSLYPCMALHSINNSLALGVSQLHWPADQTVGLMAGSLLVIAVLTGPLAGRGRPSPRLAGGS